MASTEQQVQVPAITAPTADVVCLPLLLFVCFGNNAFKVKFLSQLLVILGWECICSSILPYLKSIACAGSPILP